MSDDHWQMLGHTWAVELLQGHLAAGKSRHAYLITGPNGVGRRTLALRLAQALNCSQPPAPGEFCGQCRACRLLEKMQHPDLAVVQAEQVGGTLKVDQIRELQRGLNLAPYEARYRIALLLRFEEAHTSAANALLKTLEEPAPQVVLILTAEDTEILLPTIVSRCEILRLRPLGLEETAAGLQARWQIPAEQARLLAHLSAGRPGYAIHLHQNPEQLEQRRAWLDEHRHLLSANRTERFAYAETLSKDKGNLQKALLVWLTLWRDLLLRSSGAHAPLTNLDREAEIAELAAHFKVETARAMITAIENTQTQLAQNANTRLAFEVLLLDLPRI